MLFIKKTFESFWAVDSQLDLHPHRINNNDNNKGEGMIRLNLIGGVLSGCETGISVIVTMLLLNKINHTY